MYAHYIGKVYIFDVCPDKQIKFYLIQSNNMKLKIHT